MTTPWQVKGIPEALRRRLKASAVMRGITIGQWLIEAITEKLDREKED